MLETVKMLLGIDVADTSKDMILNHFINQAIRLALSYCNVYELSAEYDGAVADLLHFFIKTRIVSYISEDRGERR